MRSLTDREQKLIAIGILVALIALVWFAILNPLIGGFSDRAQARDELRLTWSRNARAIQSMPAWRASAEAQKRTADRFSINAPSESLASEVLKARLQHLATDEGFNISGLEEDSSAAAPGETRVRANAELTLTQLCDSLRRLESEGAYVVVDYLSISADRALASGREAPLDVRLELSAAYRPASGGGV